MSAKRKHILVVDDDDAIRNSLAIALKLNGFETSLAATLEEAHTQLESIENHLILLDLDLPDGSGFELLEHVRQAQSDLPVIVLTATLDEDSAYKGLEMGAQDYVRKPFGVKELVARIERTLGRPIMVNQSLQMGDLILNVSQRKLVHQEKEVALTKRQTEILEILISRPGDIVSRERVLDHFKDQGDLLDRSIDAHIFHVRKKLEKVSESKVTLKTVYGSGYKLECE